MKILFMGTPDFAATVLREIISAGFTVCGVISQPDKPKNRGMRMEPTPVKAAAETAHIPVYQPVTLKNEAILPYLHEKKPDLILVVAYGKILPPYILSFPRFGCINMHASLLPKYRGAAPIQWSILNGETKTGVTAMYMEEGLDTGDMLMRTEVDITESDNAETLHDRLADAAASLAVQTIRAAKAGTLVRQKQDDAVSSYAPMLSKELGNIDWSKSTSEILNKIRGLYPWPGAYSHKDGTPFKVIQAKRASGGGRAGEVLQSEKRLVVATGDGAIEILEMQLPGKKKMPAAVCMLGNRFAEHSVLGG